METDPRCDWLSSYILIWQSQISLAVGFGCKVTLSQAKEMVLLMNTNNENTQNKINIIYKKVT